MNPTDRPETADVFDQRFADVPPGAPPGGEADELDPVLVRRVREEIAHAYVEPDGPTATVLVADLCLMLDTPGRLTVKIRQLSAELEAVRGERDKANAEVMEWRVTSFDAGSARRYKLERNAVVADLATARQERDELRETMRLLVAACPKPVLEQFSYDEPPDYRTAEDHELARCLWDAEKLLAGLPLPAEGKETQP